VNERFRITAKFVPYNPPKRLSVPNILGDTEEEASPGYVEFTLDGHPCRLDPLEEGDGLFFIFKDLTSGKETYPPGRFLYAPKPKNGEVMLDFNKAVNPPCAFTPYATCPCRPSRITFQCELRRESCDTGTRFQICLAGFMYCNGVFFTLD